MYEDVMTNNMDMIRWEMDCPLDRYCLKVSGTVVDAYGYGREVAVRGCPLISLITRLEEGCNRLKLCALQLSC